MLHAELGYITAGSMMVQQIHCFLTKRRSWVRGWLDFSVCKQKKSCLCSLCACNGSLRVLRFLRLPAKDKHVMLTDDGKIDRYAQVACLGWTRPMTSGIISSLPPN